MWSSVYLKCVSLRWVLSCLIPPRWTSTCHFFHGSILWLHVGVKVETHPQHPKSRLNFHFAILSLFQTLPCPFFQLWRCGVRPSISPQATFFNLSGILPPEDRSWVGQSGKETTVPKEKHLFCKFLLSHPLNHQWITLQASI